MLRVKVIAVRQKQTEAVRLVKLKPIAKCDVYGVKYANSFRLMQNELKQQLLCKM